MKVDKEELAYGLLAHGYLGFESTRLKSGVISPYYIDLRSLSTLRSEHYYADESIRKLTVMAMAQTVHRVLPESEKPGHIMSVPEGADWLASMTAYEAQMSYAKRRLIPKAHGRVIGSDILGKVDLQDHVTLVEDIITTGSSIADEAIRLSDHGIFVSSAVSLISREDPGTNPVKDLKSIGIKFASFMTAQELIAIGADYGFFNSVQIETVEQYWQNKES